MFGSQVLIMHLSPVPRSWKVRFVVAESRWQKDLPYLTTSCTVERNVFWQAYSSVVGSSDRAVTDPAEAGSFVKAIEQLYRISKAVEAMKLHVVLNTIFNRM